MSMMRSEERDKDKKRHNEPNQNRRNFRDRKDMSETRQKHTKSEHPAKSLEVSKHKKDETRKVRITSGVEKKSNERNKHQDSIGRHDRAHRNSAVELVNRGCRNTDSSSSTSDEEANDKKNTTTRKKGSNVQQGKKNQREESFRELSDRKRRIESELRALDAEEAAEAEKKKVAKNHSNHHHHHQDREKKRGEERTVRIKKELTSDENGTNNRKKIQHERETVRVKREPVSDDDRRSSRPHKFPKREQQPVQVKQERSHSASRQHRTRHSSDSHRRRNAGAASRSGATSMEWGRPEDEESEKKEVKEKEKPNFEKSGKLAEDTNTFNGVVIKYNEPPEARKPRRKWRLYPFKGDTHLPFIPVHRQSAYLLGRSRLIADIPIDHPSCSKQHAVLQFRLTPYTRDDGTKGRSVRPYVIDLDSSNGTYVNNNKVEPRRYTELFEKDVLKFGYSSRVYVILHEDSKNEDENDDEED